MSVNNMDSINRPTSRVLAAPGGRSSNIFGTDPEPAPLPGKKQANNRNASSIFGSDPVESEKPKKVEEKPQEVEKKEVPETKLEEKTEPDQDQPQKRTAVKVHAPPGGKSSIFFG